MGKLFQLKRWLTLGEAAGHLETIFGESVSEADILRLALDRKLKISVVFSSSSFASFCDIREHEKPHFKKIKFNPDGTFASGLVEGLSYRLGNMKIQPRRTVHALQMDEPYELAMLGGEVNCLRSTYHALIGKAIPNEPNKLGAILLRDDTYYEVKREVHENSEPFRRWRASDFESFGNITDTGTLVVTTSAILEFEQSLTENRKEKPLQKRERDTLLTIIGILCTEAKLDYKTHAKTAALLQTAALHLDISIGETTIEGHLKRVAEAMGDRSK